MRISTACASASSGISRRPRTGSFQRETTRDGDRPGGSDRCTKPNEVRVTTADPGSSARTLAYRAVHRDASCGPSRRVVTTRVGPMARSRSATSSRRARSSQTSETRVTPSASSRSCTARLGTAMASHHRIAGGSAAARWYCSIWLSSRNQRWCLFWRYRHQRPPNQTPRCSQLAPKRPPGPGGSRTPATTSHTRCRVRSASSSPMSPGRSALSGRTTMSTEPRWFRADRRTRSARSRSSSSAGANSKKPCGSGPAGSTAPVGLKSSASMRNGHGSISTLPSCAGPPGPTVPAGPGGPAQEGNVLMLPWPLRIDAEDFKPTGAVEPAGPEPHGFFEFAPAELLDLDLADRVLRSARNQRGSVDIVVRPESALRPGDIGELEALLTRHRVWLVVAGVREPPGPGGRFGANWLHLGVWFGGRWWRYRQNKHHRWSLDDQQIEQYHLAAALPPTVRWWEAMAVPRRAVQVVELDEGVTLVSLICEDLARLDEVADLLRAIGPTLVVTTLLDGPQLASRWTARYASVLADDPGSAVVTLTSFGFVQRSLPTGRPPSRVVSLWKDPVRGLREIPLDEDAHALLIHIRVGQTTRRSADGRHPVANVADIRAEGVSQIRALDRGDHISVAMPEAPVDDEPVCSLKAAEVTILTGWAEAVA